MCSALTPSGLHLDLSKTSEQMTLWSLCMSYKRAEAYTGQGDEHAVCGKHPHTNIKGNYCCFFLLFYVLLCLLFYMLYQFYKLE